MREQKRVRALILCGAFLLMLFVSSTLIVHEADHECLGEDCPICLMIAMNAELLRLFGSVLMLLMAVLLLSQIKGIHRSAGARRAAVSGTLISWKIRLND